MIKYEYAISPDKIWWDNESEDKPTQDYINAFEWVVMEKVGLSFTSPTTATLIAPIELFKKTQYFRVSLDDGEILYYLVGGYSMLNGTNYNLELEVDLFMTYGTPFLKTIETEKVEVEVVRAHSTQLERGSLGVAPLYSDPMLATVPLIFDNETNKETIVPFSVSAGFKREYVIDTGLGQLNTIQIAIGADILKGNMYYVFNGIDNDGKYDLIPILSEKETQTITIHKWLGDEGVSITKEYEWDWFNGTYTPGRQSGSADVANMIKQGYSIKKTQVAVNASQGFDVEPLRAFGWSYDPIDWNVSNASNIVYRNINDKGRYLGSVPVFIWAPRMTFQLWNSYTLTKMNGEIETCENNLKGVEDFKNENLNKFLGIYFLPNITTMKTPGTFYKYNTPAPIIEKNIFGVKAGAGGFNINVDLGKFDIDLTKKDTYNQTYSNSYSIIEFYQMTYYGNSKNWYKYKTTVDGNLSNNLVLNGIFLFNAKGVVYANNPYDKSNESFIEYPGQLPSATDEYKKYVDATISTVNTGLQQMKENQNHALMNNAFDSGMGMVKGGIQAATGNIAGGVMNGLNSVGGMFRKGGEIRRQTRQTHDKMRSSYADAKRVKGTSFATSNIMDSANIPNNYSVGVGFGETIESRIPELNCLKMLNNVLFFYGNYVPKIGTMDVLLPREHFNYLEINSLWLERNIKLNSKYSDALRNGLIEMVLSKGFRIWKNGKPNLKVEN